MITAQASLVARWVSLGFVHGVMNTDNCAVSGETLDYGPALSSTATTARGAASSIDRQALTPSRTSPAWRRNLRAPRRGAAPAAGRRRVRGGG
ncbi:MAG: protein adenylyltransferase SelO family protein [Polyangiales bacterium]